jgi:DNA polymerase I-like protein with 3'-5' exonuclease and polymerase domains
MRVCFGDLEANGLLAEATKVHCGVFKDKGTKEVNKFRPDDIPAMLKYLDTVDVLIMHNGIGYDWPLLKKLYGWEFKGKKVDTLIMSRLLDPKRQLPPHCPNKKIGPHSVEAWGYRVGRGKPEHHDWDNFSEEMLHRCTEDVEILELIYEALLQEAKSKPGSFKNAYLLSFKLFEYLQKQEQHGWLVDKPYMLACISQLDHWIKRIDKVLTPNLPNVLEIDESKIQGEYKFVTKPFLKSGKPSESVVKWLSDAGIELDASPVCGPFSRIHFRPVDLNSNAETKAYLLSEGWEPLEWNTDDNGERTSPKMSKDDPFDGINGKVGKLVARRVQCRQRKSIIEGLLTLIRPDGRIASVVNTLAATGRATHRNIVNIPKAGSFYGKQMRKIFTCAKGKVLVGTDSDSCQLRMLGGRMGSKAYIEAICNGDKSKGTDLHSLTKKIGDIESRDLAKNVMYCLLFGGGDVKLGKTAKKPGQGAELREKLYKGFDGLGELMERLKEQWKATAKRRYNAKFNRMEYYDGYIIGLDGRPIQVPNEHQLLVYLLQSDEAIFMAAAYVRANKILEKKYRYGIDYGFVCWYHDEFTIECSPEIADDVKRISEESIVWAGQFYNISCPHVGDGKEGKTWYDIH